MANNNDKFISRENAKTLWGYMIDLLTGKQNKLTFDDTPTQSSDNPVKSGGIFTALAGKGTYSKPQNGIPKTDLENAVQTSLRLADSALQSETDPTVPSWAKQTNKPSYTQDEVGDGTTYKRVSSTEKDTWNAKGTYSKPSGGIPKSDLASAVQTSLEKADSALQSYTETDPTVPSWAKQSSKPSYNSDEISDTNRTHKFATQAQLNQISTNQTNILLLQHQQNIFAYHVNPNESDPYEAVTYLENAKGMIPAKMTGGGFSYVSWGSAFFLPKPCVLKFDGTVDYYLNPYDYSKKIDGSAATIDSSNTTGNVMLEFPKIWVKRVPGATAGERTVYIADSKVDNDYKCFSNINSSNEEKDHFYIHAYNGTIHSSQMRSLSGVTLNSTYAPNYTARQEILAAKANNPSGSAVMWFTDVWSDMQLLFDLLYLMGKSLDVQRTFGQGLSAVGETAMRAYVTGTHNDKGLFYGDTVGTSTAVKVLGIENLWACRWNRIAGLINVAGNLKVKMTYGTADGSTATEYETPLDSTDATANLTGAGYLDYGTILKSNGYVSQIQADNSKGYKITSVTGGADNKYYCDYYYQASAANTKYYALLGGYSVNGAYCGFYVHLSSGAASAHWTIGGALSCKP